MKKLFSLIVILFSALSCFSQVTRLYTYVTDLDFGEKRVTIKDPSKFECYYNCSMSSGFKLKSRLPSGNYEVYENDTLVYKAFYRNRKKDSVWTYYHVNGVISNIFPYRNGQLNGLTKRFDMEGNLMEEGTYENGRMKGVWISYSCNGDMTERYYFENNEKIKHESFYGNGNIKEEENFRNGLYQGRNKEYYESGKIKRELFYESDKLTRRVLYNELGEITLDKVID